MPKTLPNIKAEILAATRQLVIERGYNKVSIRDIAGECGIATGTFYNYFRSKQAVISALLADDWARMQRFVQSHTESDLPVIRQLEDIFNDLKKMMFSVHQLWAQGFPDDFESETMNKTAQIKKQLRIDYAETVRRIIHGHTDPDKEAFIADFLARMFFSYAYESGSSFDDIRFVLEKVID